MPDTSSRAEAPVASVASWQSRQRGIGRWLVSGPPLAYLTIFFAIPLLIMVVASVRFPGEFGGLAPVVEYGEVNLTLEAYQRFFTDSIYWELFAKSVVYAALTTLACLVLAYPLAMRIARSARTSSCGSSR